MIRAFQVNLLATQTPLVVLGCADGKRPRWRDATLLAGRATAGGIGCCWRGQGLTDGTGPCRWDVIPSLGEVPVGGTGLYFCLLPVIARLR